MALRLVLTVAVVVASAAPVAAQHSPEAYLRLIDAYLRDPVTAPATLASWPRDAVERGMNGCVKRCPERQRIAAAMLQTDAAVSLVDTDPDASRFHLQVAERLLAPKGTTDPAFVARWYEFAALLSISRTWFQMAANLGETAVRRFPKDWRLWVAIGRMAEYRGAIGFRDPRAQVQDASRRRTFDVLVSATYAYRSALELNPGSPTVLLRLGWIHVLLRDDRADEELGDALRRAEDPVTRYLAYLYLGAQAEAEGRLADAAAAYHAARAAGPRYQSACLASSQANDALGRAARARAVAAECLSMEREDDPWLFFRLGLPDPDLLPWLRQESRRP